MILILNFTVGDFLGNRIILSIRSLLIIFSNGKIARIGGCFWLGFTRGHTNTIGYTLSLTRLCL